MTKDFDYEQLLAGELYLAKDIFDENTSLEGEKLNQKINMEPIENFDRIVALEKELFGKTGTNIYIRPPFYTDYGRHIELGENFYANMNCTFLDVNYIIFGDNVMIGPDASFYTAGHPTDANVRNTGLEFGLPITVEDNVWIGGHATILPGVSIGENAIVAAGSVVTKDVPKNTIVGGNPAKIIRQLNEEDKNIWNQKMASYRKKKLRY